MEILIALDLPAKIDPLVDEKRAIFYPKIIGRLEPHITLQGPAKIKSNIETIFEKCEKTAKKFSPIKIKIDGLGHFDKRVIFWQISENQNLLDLNQALKTDLKMDFEDNHRDLRKYRPHITILSRAQKSQFREIMQVLKKEKYHPQYEFICDKLMVLENLPGKPGWEKIKSFPLGKMRGN
jgi:2'-5' RNA ligase